MASPIMALASHLASALKQTLEARLAGATPGGGGATQKRECSPQFRHGTVRAFDDLGPVKEHLNSLEGSGRGEFAMFSQNSYNS